MRPQMVRESIGSCKPLLDNFEWKDERKANCAKMLDDIKHILRGMNLRFEILRLQELGPLPSEQEGTVQQLKLYEDLIRSIVSPVTDDEARILFQLFSVDTCFGLAYSLLHMIETAPGWPLSDCMLQRDNDWKMEMRNRAIRGGWAPLRECSTD